MAKTNSSKICIFVHNIMFCFCVWNDFCRFDEDPSFPRETEEV